MNLGDAVGLAVGSLRTHKLRTALTILGVVIGIGAVVAIVTLGESFEGAVAQQLGGSDARGMTVSAVRADAGGQFQRPGQPQGPAVQVRAFTSRDAAALAAVEGVEAVVPQVDLGVVAVSRAGDPLLVQNVLATTAMHADLRGGLERGAVFGAAAAEAVVGVNVTTYDGAPVQVGDTLQLRLPDNSTLEARVVGLAKVNTNPFAGGGLGGNFRVYVPEPHFYRSTVRSPVTDEGVRPYPNLYVLGRSADEAPAVKQRVLDYFGSTGADAARLLPEGYRVQVTTEAETAATVTEVLGQVTLFISAIAVISLVVGAIGIANIMLVAVTERTREIGVLKALGARNRDVRRMFLAESVMIGLLGGAVGLALGTAAGLALAGVVLQGRAEPSLPYEWFAISIVVGIGVGLLAGWLPARRATKVDPIEALNYE